MKAYVIRSAEKLKEIVPLMKWQKDRDKVAAFARVWSATERKEPEKAKKLSARIEIGRSAQVFTHRRLRYAESPAARCWELEVPHRLVAPAGRCSGATALKLIGTEVSLLGTMHLPQARTFVADMEAVQ